MRCIITDVEGVEYKIELSRDCPPDWRKYTVAINPRIIQILYPNYRNAGIYFSGIELLVNTEREEALHVGLDAVSAITDMYVVGNVHADAIPNTW